MKHRNPLKTLSQSDNYSAYPWHKHNGFHNIQKSLIQLLSSSCNYNNCKHNIKTKLQSQVPLKYVKHIYRKNTVRVVSFRILYLLNLPSSKIYASWYQQKTKT